MNRHFLHLLIVFPFISTVTKATEETNSRKNSSVDVLQQVVKDVTNDPDEPTFDLKYSFKAGECLRWKVTHLVTVETKIQGTSQIAKTRSNSTKAWRIASIDSEKRATLAHLVEDIDMWQKVSGREEIHYNSKTDDQPPPEYENAAASVGIILSKITLQPNGEIVERIDRRKTPGFGGGQITIPLPKEPVKIGESWNFPNTIPVKLDNGTITKLKSRQLYTLEKVVAGLATISLKTEVLTPVQDPRIKVQLVQRLLNGTVKFDINVGRIVAQRMDLDEKVLAFNGADSSMHYRARFTEKLLPAKIESDLSLKSDKSTAQQPVETPTLEISQTKARPRREPIFRR